MTAADDRAVDGTVSGDDEPLTGAADALEDARRAGAGDDGDVIEKDSQRFVGTDVAGTPAEADDTGIDSEGAAVGGADADEDARQHGGERPR